MAEYGKRVFVAFVAEDARQSQPRLPELFMNDKSAAQIPPVASGRCLELENSKIVNRKI
jgi:hypothetical protein